MTDKELMQMALDALDDGCGKYTEEYRNLIEALRTALAQPDFERTVWMNGYKAGYAQAQETDLAIPQKEPTIDKSMAKRIATQLGWEPKKEWVGLTHKELEDCILISEWATWIEVGRAIEQALKGKNNG